MVEKIKIFFYFGKETEIMLIDKWQQWENEMDGIWGKEQTEREKQALCLLKPVWILRQWKACDAPSSPSCIKRWQDELLGQNNHHDNILVTSASWRLFSLFV